MGNFKPKDIASAASSIVNSLVEEVLGNTELQKIIFGKYSDGSPRNLTDALEGEVYSPHQKDKMEKKHKKNKKKKKKKGSKYAKIDLSSL